MDGHRDDRQTAADEDDFDLDEHIDWVIREIEAGRQQVPPEREAEGPAVSVSLGDAADVDPALLAALCGPDGLGGQALSAAFGQDAAADVLRPGPVLAALTAEQASRVGDLSDDEVIGVVQASRRLANWADYLQTVGIAVIARRRQAQYEAAAAKGKPPGCRDGEFPGAELAMELVDTPAYAGLRVDTALELTGRLPRTLAAMADGSIDLCRALTIASRTAVLTDADAAYADEVLAAAAPGKRPDQLARKAAALEMKLAPEAVRARKELARQLDQRVEARREASGNASLAGRELDAVQVMASKAHIDAVAAQLRDSGQFDATMGQLRALVLTDLTQGREPLDRITAQAVPQTQAQAVPQTQAARPPAGTAPPVSAVRPAGPEHQAPGDPATLPALINVVIPVETLLGHGTAPAAAAGWGLLDAGEARAFTRAAAGHPRTRWCVTVTARDGTAVAHGCAPGRHPWPGTGPPWPHGLAITLEPVARDTCDHAHAEDRYVPSRKLRHLIRARGQTCSAPGCNAQAVSCDIDHTVPYPDGPTCECNLNPKCRRHHRVKQAPGWRVTQPVPGTAAWTTPSGRTHATSATVYDH